MKCLILCILLAAFLSCKENAAVQESTNLIDSSRIDQVKIINETDPICNMNVKEHLSDTALINGEIWGFCSVVCKEKYINSKKSK